MGRPVVYRKHTTIEFNVDGVGYQYEWISTPSAGIAKLFKGTEEIYGPTTTTEEGNRLLDLLKESGII